MSKQKKKMEQQHIEEIALLKKAFKRNLDGLLKESREQDTPYPVEELSVAQTVLNKRMYTAARRFLPKLHETFSNKFQSSEYVKYYILLISSHDGRGEYIDEDCFPLLGAAIWLLDYFEEKNMLSDLLVFLPKECKSIEEYGMPYIKDFNHSEQMINAVVALIMERDEEYKEQFDKLCKMVNGKVVSNLKKIYEKNVIDYIDIYLGYAISNDDKREAFFKSLSENYKLDEQRDKLNSTLIGPLEKSRILINIDSQLANITLEAEQFSHALCEEQALFVTDSPLVSISTCKVLMNLVGEEHSEKLANYGTGDPYEICAAYLFLTIDDDDLLYLSTPSAVALRYGASGLPWNGNVDAKNLNADFNQMSYDLIYNCTDSSSNIFPNGLSDSFYNSFPDGYLDSFAERFPDRSPYRLPINEMCNYQQILYSISKQIAPRQMKKATTNDKFLAEFNVPKEVCDEIFCISSLLDTLDKPTRILFDEEVDDDEYPDDEAEVEQSFDELKSQNEILLRKLKDMQLLASDERRVNARLNREIEKQGKLHESERNELISLREALFLLHQAEPEEAVDSKIHFPYETERNICVFGGHDTWAKAIKPLLPKVKFISREVPPHPNLIKNADVIWLQTNSMSHRYYNHIISVVRNHNIICKYFGYASAQKCAEQLVNNEIIAT